MIVLRHIKYRTSHCLLYIRTVCTQPRVILQLLCQRFPQFINETMNRNLTLRYIGYLSNVLLMVALCVGLYTRWMATQEITLALLAIFGLFVFAISCALVYYFSMEVIGFSLSRLWIGCLLGVIAFTQIEIPEEDNRMEEVMNILLVGSILLRALWNILERSLNFSEQQFALVNFYESLEMIGICISTIVTGNDIMCLSLLVIALSFVVVNIRLKSFLGVIQLFLLILITTTVYFPHLLDVKINPIAMSAFLMRMAFESVLDLYYCPLSTLERWQYLFNRAAALRRLFIMCGVGLELAFIIINAIQIPHHKEWYIVVPIFAAFGAVWFCYHLVFLITCWQMSNKITDCCNTYRGILDESKNMRRIMAAKGVRHFSLISQRLVCVSLVTTIVIGAIGWVSKTALSLSILFTVVPLESAVLSMLWHMGSYLGGTIIGYALVAPALPIKVGQGTTVLPTTAVTELSGRATLLLNMVQRFLSRHLIDNFGCDYSSSGLSVEAAEAKLRTFFQRHSADGPKYDTYMVYYSGHVYENGDWALAGGSTLKLETLLEWWQEYNNSTSRLILVLDTDHSSEWLRPVRRIRNCYVAIQTCRILTPTDPEEGNRVMIGNFTREWMEYNTSSEGVLKAGTENGGGSGTWGSGSLIDSGETSTNNSTAKYIKAMYGVSRCWTDFSFHLPTDEDIRTHWDSNFPRATKPLVAATNFPRCGSSVFCCCDCLIRCIQRKRMSWFPPLEYETGHGFKLIRSK